MRQLLDLARFMFPHGVVPRRWRSSDAYERLKDLTRRRPPDPGGLHAFIATLPMPVFFNRLLGSLSSFVAQLV